MWTYNYSSELYHHGILGQKWGIRRYQNPDGTLTPTGKEHVKNYVSKELRVNNEIYDESIRKYQKLQKKYANDPEKQKEYSKLIEDAENDRKRVNSNIEKTTFEDIQKRREERNAKIDNTIKKYVSYMAYSTPRIALTVGSFFALGKGVSVFSNIGNKLSSIDGDTTIEYINKFMETPAGEKIFSAITQGIVANSGISMSDIQNIKSKGH